MLTKPITYRVASPAHLMSILAGLPGMEWEYIDHGYWGELRSTDKMHHITLGVKNGNSR